MAWLQRRPQVSDPVMYYSVGLNKSLLVVGLGNPGDKYKLTRHNIGFDCIEDYVKQNVDMSQWLIKKEFNCLFSSGKSNKSKIYAIKPLTFMNNSGQSVSGITQFYNIPTEDILVVYDDLDLSFGQIRTRVGGSSAGHKGIESITNHVGENFNRIRIGIGPKKPAKLSSEEYVLKKFSKSEREQFSNLKKEVVAIISEFVYGEDLPHETRNFLL